MDAAAAAIVDYSAEQRRAEQEEANLVKTYMAGGGHNGWMKGVGGTKADNVAPSGLHFAQIPQYATGLPSRACSTTSLNVAAEKASATKHSNDGNHSGLLGGNQKCKWGRRSRLRNLQCMLRQAAAEGFRLLQGAKKQERTGGTPAQSRSFLSGATATAAAVAASSSKDCSTEVAAAPVAAEQTYPGIPTAARKGRSIEGGVLVGEAAGADTSTLLLQRLAQGTQLLAKELDEHIRSFAHAVIPSCKGFLAARMKRRALRPWRRAAVALREKKQQQKQQGEGQRKIICLSSKALGRAYSDNSSAFVAASPGAEEAESRRRSQLLLKEELRRRVYEQLEARAADRQSQPSGESAGGTGEPSGNERQQGRVRVFKTGFDSDPPSSHGSYETATDFESSESAPTEAYVSPSSSCSSTSRSSSRSSSSSRASSNDDDRSGQAPSRVAAVGNPSILTQAAASSRRCYSRASNSAAAEEPALPPGTGTTTADATYAAAPLEPTSLRQYSDELHRRRSKRPDFQWVAAYSKQQHGGSEAAVRKGRRRHVALSISSERGPLRQQLEKFERSRDQQGQAALRQDSASSLRIMQQRRGLEKGSVGSIDLEAYRAQSFVSEKGTLDSLPDSDCCEPSSTLDPVGELPLLVSPPLRAIKRRIRRHSNPYEGMASSNCESIAALIESLAPSREPALVGHMKRDPAAAAAEGWTDVTALASPTATEAASGDCYTYTEGGGDAPALMAKGGAQGGVSARMQQLYASCLQRARSSFLSGKRQHLNGNLLHLREASGVPEAPAVASASAAQIHVEAPIVTSPAEIHPTKSSTSHVTRSSPVVGKAPGPGGVPLPDARTSSAASSVVIPPLPHPAPTFAGEGSPLKVSETAAGAPGDKGRKFIESKEHGMMLDIDYDQVSRNWGATNNTATGPPVSVYSGFTFRQGPADDWLQAREGTIRGYRFDCWSWWCCFAAAGPTGDGLQPDNRG